jgi:hypothetical protein
MNATCHNSLMRKSETYLTALNIQIVVEAMKSCNICSQIQIVSQSIVSQIMALQRRWMRNNIWKFERLYPLVTKGMITIGKIHEEASFIPHDQVDESGSGLNCEILFNNLSSSYGNTTMMNTIISSSFICASCKSCHADSIYCWENESCRRKCLLLSTKCDLSINNHFDFRIDESPSIMITSGAGNPHPFLGWILIALGFLVVELCRACFGYRAWKREERAITAAEDDKQPPMTCVRSSVSSDDGILPTEEEMDYEKSV